MPACPRKSVATDLMSTVTDYQICWIPGCKSRSDDLSDESFFPFPTVSELDDVQTKGLAAERHKAWLMTIGMSMVVEDSKICSKHFTTGR